MKGVGGYNGWRWIFILEGLLTIIVSIVAYFWVYNYPDTAEFLTEEERDFIQFRLKNDSDATRDEAFTWSAVLDAFKDPKTWLYGLGFHTMSLPLYTLSLFLVSKTILLLNSLIKCSYWNSRLSLRNWAIPRLKHSCSVYLPTPWRSARLSALPFYRNDYAFELLLSWDLRRWLALDIFF
jgi:hypothetical protein